MGVVNQLLTHLLSGPPCCHPTCIRVQAAKDNVNAQFVSVKETQYISKTDTLIKLKEITNKLDKYIKKES